MRLLRSPFLFGTLLVPPAFVACLAVPPRAVYEIEHGTVRADDPQEARAVADLLAVLRPRLLACLPDAREDHVEVWLQDEPRLYRFPHEAGSDAEGLYAPSQGRILLSRGLEDMERVLAHELVHATLGPSWSRLPGTLEEGLCDALAARVSGQGVERLRAGRLSSAALACGGLQLVVTVRTTGPDGTRRGWAARVSLSSDERVEDPGRDVFQVEAGLSSTKLEPNVKRGLYGLSFLLVDRVVERVGVEGLHRLCLEAEREGRSKVSRQALLGAAELDGDVGAWRTAAAASMRPGDLADLARMYPGIVADVVLSRGRVGPGDLEGLEIEIGCAQGEERARIHEVPEVRAAIQERLGL